MYRTLLFPFYIKFCYSFQRRIYVGRRCGYLHRTYFACHYRHACVYCLHECLVCATMSFQPLTPPGASGHARTHALEGIYLIFPLHALHTRSHHRLHVLSPGRRSGPRSTFLVGCVANLSLPFSCSSEWHVPATYNATPAYCDIKVALSQEQRFAFRLLNLRTLD